MGEFTNDLEKIKHCANLVFKQLGFGLNESVYNKALQFELLELYKSVESEYHVNQYYTTQSGKKIQLTSLRLDLLVDDRIIIEIKTVINTNKKHISQCRRYLNITKNKDLYLVNFGLDGIEINQIL